MRSVTGVVVGLGIGVGLSGCHEGAPGTNEDAILAAAVAVPAAIAANAVQAQQARQASERHDPSLKAPLRLKATTTCGPRTYSLYCTVDDRRCVFRTQYDFEYACEKPNCEDGPPPALVAWCNG